MYYLGLDLGQSADPTALCVVEKVRLELDQAAENEVKRSFSGRNRGTLAQQEAAYLAALRRATPTEHQLRHLERVELGTSYPAIVEKVKEMVGREPLAGKYQIIADATGCGRPVIDLLRQSRLNVVPVLITGGHQVNFSDGYYHVPKRDLVSTLLVLMGNRRLKFSPHLPDREMLITELQAFSLTINEKANDIYEGRQGVHDDEVLAVALAAWYSELHGQAGEPEIHYPQESPYKNLRV